VQRPTLHLPRNPQPSTPNQVQEAQQQSAALEGSPSPASPTKETKEGVAEGNGRPASGEVGWGGPASGEGQRKSSGGGGGGGAPLSEAIGAISPTPEEGAPSPGAPALKEGIGAISPTPTPELKEGPGEPARIASAASDTLGIQPHVG